MPLSILCKMYKHTQRDCGTERQRHTFTYRVRCQLMPNNQSGIQQQPNTIHAHLAFICSQILRLYFCSFIFCWIFVLFNNNTRAQANGKYIYFKTRQWKQLFSRLVHIGCLNECCTYTDCCFPTNRYFAFLYSCWICFVVSFAALRTYDCCIVHIIYLSRVTTRKKNGLLFIFAIHTKTDAKHFSRCLRVVVSSYGIFFLLFKFWAH